MAFITSMYKKEIHTMRRINSIAYLRSNSYDINSYGKNGNIYIIFVWTWYETYKYHIIGNINLYTHTIAG